MDVTTRDPWIVGSVGTDWALIPLRIPTGWQVRWNGLCARRLPDGSVEHSDSEDLLWLTKLPPPDGKPYSTRPDSPWREIHLDAGFYRDGFRVVLLDPDWDHVLASCNPADLPSLIKVVERWLLGIHAGNLTLPKDARFSEP